KYHFTLYIKHILVIQQILIKYRVKTLSLHWRQSVVFIELVLLLITPFVQLDFLANSLVSFACAMQLQSFRKVHGYPFASTMCIGNLRSGLDHLVCFFETKDANKLAQAFQYFRIILIFIIGAGLGKWASDIFGLYAIWGSVLLLLFAWALMFLDPHPSIPLED
ncbi:MAG: YoaK family protein, partial [Erysipelotrichaceae bacterium]|nr:YoaK family protein [Erysipelotrichaceae bacterium]